MFALKSVHARYLPEMFVFIHHQAFTETQLMILERIASVRVEWSVFALGSELRLLFQQ